MKKWQKNGGQKIIIMGKKLLKMRGKKEKWRKKTRKKLLKKTKKLEKIRIKKH